MITSHNIILELGCDWKQYLIKSILLYNDLFAGLPCAPGRAGKTCKNVTFKSLTALGPDGAHRDPGRHDSWYLSESSIMM